MFGMRSKDFRIPSFVRFDSISVCMPSGCDVRIFGCLCRDGASRASFDRAEYHPSFEAPPAEPESQSLRSEVRETSKPFAAHAARRAFASTGATDL